MLRALASVGIFREDDDRRFALPSLGECLRHDVRDTVGGWAAFIGQPYYWQAWAHLLHSVKAGEKRFAMFTGWTSGSTEGGTGR